LCERRVIQAPPPGGASPGRRQANSIPDYAPLASEAIHSLGPSTYVFAGQRADGFYVDLGSIFDLSDLRPFQPDFLLKGSAVAGINTLAGLNVHSIAIQVPIRDLTRDGTRPTVYTAAEAANQVTSATWA
jgi:hypothetical protein